MPTLERLPMVELIRTMSALLVPEPPARMGATCPACGSTNSHRVEVKNGDVVVRVYFACNDCGNVW